jgi:8-oxo-dGTP diphosphatase
MREETGQEVSNVEFLTVTNDVFTAERKHYTTNFLAAMVKGDQKDPRVSLPLSSSVVK